MTFAKVFEQHDDPTSAEQVVVMLKRGDDGPEVRFWFEPPGLGVCEMAISWPDTDADWDHAERTFRDIGDIEARAFIAESYASALALAGDE